MRVGYYGGAPGVLASALVWFTQRLDSAPSLVQ
jgi:hypothetical protein